MNDKLLISGLSLIFFLFLANKKTFNYSETISKINNHNQSLLIHGFIMSILIYISFNLLNNNNIEGIETSISNSEPTSRWISDGFPQCNVPYWQYNSEQEAEKCGRWNGGAWGRWLMLIFGMPVIIASIIFSAINAPLKGVLLLGVMVIMMIMFFLIVLPSWFAYHYKSSWVTEKSKMAALKNTGMSDKEVGISMQMQSMQELQSSQYAAGATSNLLAAGLLVGSSSPSGNN